MITELTTVKARLGLDQYDVRYDSILTNAIKALGARFDKICNRKFNRAVDTRFEFDSRDVEIIPLRYPIESVSLFEAKETEDGGWSAQTDVKYLVRNDCVISLAKRIGMCGLGRVTYTGGYVMPGATPASGQTALPDDLEQAAVEQVASWFQNRDKLGLVRHWPKGGIYQQFAQAELLPGVREALKGHERVVLW